jgi:hypothetical protein
MTPASALIPPGREQGTHEPWIEVREASGSVLQSGGLSALRIRPHDGIDDLCPLTSYCPLSGLK